jgi:flagellar hook protein FlgE
MSLASVLNTSYSGMFAATFSVDAISHNMANAQTNGYKSSRPIFAALPSWSSGSLSFGSGVTVSGTATDDSPGSQILEAEGVVETSNTDIGQELIELILAENHFLANANVFGTAVGMLDGLMYLGRRA